MSEKKFFAVKATEEHDGHVCYDCGCAGWSSQIHVMFHDDESRWGLCEDCVNKYKRISEALRELENQS